MVNHGKNDVERATLILKGLRTDESTVDYEIHWGNLTTTNLLMMKLVCCYLMTLYCHKTLH